MRRKNRRGFKNWLSAFKAGKSPYHLANDAQPAPSSSINENSKIDALKQRMSIQANNRIYRMKIRAQRKLNAMKRSASAKCRRYARKLNQEQNAFSIQRTNLLNSARQTVNSQASSLRHKKSMITRQDIISLRNHVIFSDQHRKSSALASLSSATSYSASKKYASINYAKSSAITSITSRATHRFNSYATSTSVSNSQALSQTYSTGFSSFSSISSKSTSNSQSAQDEFIAMRDNCDDAVSKANIRLNKAVQQASSTLHSTLSSANQRLKDTIESNKAESNASHNQYINNLKSLSFSDSTSALATIGSLKQAHQSSMSSFYSQSTQASSIAYQRFIAMRDNCDKAIGMTNDKLRKSLTKAKSELNQVITDADSRIKYINSVDDSVRSSADSQIAYSKKVVAMQDSDSAAQIINNLKTQNADSLNDYESESASNAKYYQSQIASITNSYNEIISNDSAKLTQTITNDNNELKQAVYEKNKRINQETNKNAYLQTSASDAVSKTYKTTLRSNQQSASRVISGLKKHNSLNYQALYNESAHNSVVAQSQEQLTKSNCNHAISVNNQQTSQKLSDANYSIHLLSSTNQSLKSSATSQISFTTSSLSQSKDDSTARLVASIRSANTSQISSMNETSSSNSIRANGQIMIAQDSYTDKAKILNTNWGHRLSLANHQIGEIKSAGQSKVSHISKKAKLTISSNKDMFRASASQTVASLQSNQQSQASSYALASQSTAKSYRQSASQLRDYYKNQMASLNSVNAQKLLHSKSQIGAIDEEKNILRTNVTGRIYANYKSISTSASKVISNIKNSDNTQFTSLSQLSASNSAQASQDMKLMSSNDTKKLSRAQYQANHQIHSLKVSATSQSNDAKRNYQQRLSQMSSTSISNSTSAQQSYTIASSSNYDTATSIQADLKSSALTQKVSLDSKYQRTIKQVKSQSNSNALRAQHQRTSVEDSYHSALSSANHEINHITTSASDALQTNAVYDSNSASVARERFQSSLSIKQSQAQRSYSNAVTTIDSKNQSAQSKIMKRASNKIKRITKASRSNSNEAQAELASTKHSYQKNFHTTISSNQANYSKRFQSLAKNSNSNAKQAQQQRESMKDSYYDTLSVVNSSATVKISQQKKLKAKTASQANHKITSLESKYDKASSSAQSSYYDTLGLVSRSAKSRILQLESNSATNASQARHHVTRKRESYVNSINSSINISLRQMLSSNESVTSSQNSNYNRQIRSLKSRVALTKSNCNHAISKANSQATSASQSAKYADKSLKATASNNSDALTAIDYIKKSATKVINAKSAQSNRRYRRASQSNSRIVSSLKASYASNIRQMITDSADIDTKSIIDSIQTSADEMLQATRINNNLRISKIKSHIKDAQHKGNRK